MASQNKQVLYLAIARRDDRAILASRKHGNVSKTEHDFTADVQRVLSSPGWASVSTDKLSLEDGDRMFYILLDDEGRVYIAVTTSTYPGRHIYPTSDHSRPSILGELRDEVSSRFAEISETVSANGLQRQAKSILDSLLKKYNDLLSIDKLAAVQSKVDEVSGHVRQSVEKALVNTERIDELDIKSQQLQQSAHKFQQGGTALRRKMQLRYYKVLCIVALFVIAILAYILVPIIQKASK